MQHRIMAWVCGSIDGPVWEATGFWKRGVFWAAALGGGFSAQDVTTAVYSIEVGREH
jgi:hypothetical protein